MRFQPKWRLTKAAKPAAIEYADHWIASVLYLNFYLNVPGRNVTLAGSTDRSPEAVASRLTGASAVYYKTKQVRAQSRKLQKTLTEKGMS